MEDLIIVGAGPIGLYAATLASLHGLKGILLEGLDNVGGQLSSLYPEKEIIDLPGFTSITAQKFIDELLNQQKNQKQPLPIHLNEKLESYHKENDYFSVKTNLKEYQSKTILLVSGMGVFTPRKLDLPNIDQYQNIIYSIKEKNSLANKEIVILGGGDSAVDWANTLSSISSKVTIIHRRNDFRAQESSVKRMIDNHVTILKPFQVKSIFGKNNTAESITLIDENNKEKTLRFDYLFVNYGLVTVPTKFDLDLHLNSFKVNTFMMTSQENIFAIGNACYYEGKVKNITSGLGEAVTAITKIDQIIHPNKNIPVHF